MGWGIGSIAGEMAEHGWKNIVRKSSPLISLDVSPDVGKVRPGGVVKAVVDVKPSHVRVAWVTLSASRPPLGSGLPAGLVVSFDPDGGMPPFRSIMSVSTSPSISPGTYPFLVVGRCEDAVGTETYTLLVLKEEGEIVKKEAWAAPGEPLSIALAPALISTLGGTDVPLYPKACLTDESTRKDWTRHIYTTADSIDNVCDFYKAEMPKHGWVLVSETSGVPAGLKYAKQNTEAIITISSLKLTTISLMIGPKTST